MNRHINRLKDQLPNRPVVGNDGSYFPNISNIKVTITKLRNLPVFLYQTIAFVFLWIQNDCTKASSGSLSSFVWLFPLEWFIQFVLVWLSLQISMLFTLLYIA